MKVRYFLPADEIKDGEDWLNYQLACRRTIDDRDKQISKKQRFFANAEYIDPGLSFRHSYITFVPAEAAFVWVQCELLFPSWYQILRWKKQEKLKPKDKKKLRLKNAQKLFKVPKEIATKV